MKSWHIYKALSEIHAFAINRKGWIELEACDPFKANEVKKKILLSYLKEIRTPLLKYKETDLAAMNKRADQTNILLLQD